MPASVPIADAGYASVSVVLADEMPGVRAGLRWLLAHTPRVAVIAEAGSIAEALAAPGDVVVAGLRFADGAVAELLRAARPAIVYTWLPDDEHDIDLNGAAAVLATGELRERLPSAILAAAAR